jgi:DNA-binding transcriptional regulator YiaG
MSMKSSFRAVLERRERTKAKSPVRSASPVPFVLVLDDVKQPIELLRLLKKYGLSLRKAHETLNRLANGETVAVELHADAPGRVVSEFAALGVAAHAIEPPQSDVRRVRERLGLSQAEFALRFGLELATVQNWGARTLPPRSCRAVGTQDHRQSSGCRRCGHGEALRSFTCPAGAR